MLKRFRTGASILTALCLVSPLVFADEAVSIDEAVSTDATVKEAFEKDKTGTNPINFTNDARLYNEYRWLNTEGDGSQNLVTAEYRMPFASGKWQLRAKVRRVDLKADFNNDGFDNVDEGGMGDTDIRFMTVPYLSMEKKMGVAQWVSSSSSIPRRMTRWVREQHRWPPSCFCPSSTPLVRGASLCRDIST
jgi:hypothetical protein